VGVFWFGEERAEGMWTHCAEAVEAVRRASAAVVRVEKCIFVGAVWKISRKRELIGKMGIEE
jgi:hypothetical protein